MKKNIIFCLLVLSLMILGCSAQTQQQSQQTSTQQTTTPTQATGAEPAAASGSSILINGFSFRPKELTVAKGTSVTWTNQEPTKHSVISDDGKFESTIMAEGKSWSYTFNDAGTYTYHCGIHPGMTGTVVVE